jgi:hypothetical protein
MGDGEDKLAEDAGEMGRDEANGDAAARDRLRPTKDSYDVVQRPSTRTDLPARPQLVSVYSSVRRSSRIARGGGAVACSDPLTLVGPPDSIAVGCLSPHAARL